jgi:DNA-binding LacI/PurR family transcriptional regulator
LGEPRIKDVAALAGVSTATVSRVMHRNGYVSEDARARVEAALRESGYRLNAVAQGLRRQRTTTLGHIVQGLLPNPFYAEVAMGVEHGADERGFTVLLFNARGDAERERQGVETLLARRVDGIVFTTALEEANVRLAHEAGTPVVEVEKPLFASAGSVIADEYAGALEAMRHLLELGHRRIGFLGEPHRPSRGASKTRFDAYRDALASAGEDVDPSRVVVGTYWQQPGYADLRPGFDYTERLLAQAPDTTAIFAASDVLAAGALQDLYARGVRVPDDVSVVGFDDTLARHLAPALTTVQMPMFEM